MIDTSGLEALGKAHAFTAEEFTEHLQRVAPLGPKVAEVVAPLEHRSTGPCDVCGRGHPGPGTPRVCDR